MYKKYTVLLLLVLCTGCRDFANSPSPAPVVAATQNPADPCLVELPPATDAVVKELQTVVNRVCQVAEVAEPLPVVVLPELYFGLQALPMREADGGRSLYVAETLLTHPDRNERVESMVCLLGLRLRGATIPMEIAYEQCLYLVAVRAREPERARWIWRTLPEQFRPANPPRYVVPPLPRCRKACAIAVDRLA